MSIPVQHGGYGESLREVFVRYANTDSRYYALVSSMAAFVGVLISIAAVPLTYEVSRASGCNYDEKLLASALSRGFITCMIWAPTSATIALVVQLTGVDWVAFFPFAIACALIAGAVGFLMTFVRDEAAKASSDEAEAPAGKIDAGKVVELSAFAFLLVVSVAATSQLGGLSAIVVVAMASLVFPVAWMAAIGRLPTYAREFRGTTSTTSFPSRRIRSSCSPGLGSSRRASAIPIWVMLWSDLFCI